MTVTLPADTDTVTTEDLRRFTNAMIDRAQGLLRRCQDVDVTFLPQDPLAHDPGAEPGHEQNAAWTLGHIIVHMTASAEESAAGSPTTAAHAARFPGRA